MIINDNLAALNTFNALNKNTNAMNQALAELSSGKQINSAADNPSGLTISEQMQGQISGLNQANSNTQDGISLIQTAMGGLTETSSILQSMRELAVQAANGTNTTQDFQAIQDQINQYTSEISAIGNTTQFNTMDLLNGGSGASTAAGVSSNGLTVAPNLTGGQGVSGTTTPATPASAAISITASNLVSGDHFSLNIGGQSLTVTYSSGATASSLNGNAITIGIGAGGDTTNTAIASDMTNQINNFISSNATLKNNYVATNPADGKVTVSATAVALNTSGVLTGPLNGGTVTAANGSTNGVSGTFTNTSAKGVYANGSINFSGATVAKLAGTGINVDGQSIAFYDSANGKYTGNADFAIDLNGDQTAGQIVNTIVTDMAGAAGGKIAASQNGAAYATNNSAIAGVLLSASSSGNALNITAATVGAGSNGITMGNVAPVTVTQTNGNTKLSGAQVDSAMGLADGEQKITLTRTAAATTTQTTSGNLASDGLAIGIASGSDLTAGMYRLTGTGVANHVQLQEQSSNGSWSAVKDVNGNVLSGTLTGGAANSVTLGDLTLTTTSYASGDFTAVAGTTSGTADSVTFTVDPNHYDATLTEAGSTTAGQSVQVSNGQTNVNLVAANGIGQATVNIGSFDPTNFTAGADGKIAWSFNTQAAPSSTQAGNGSFTTNLQIGANQNQTMTISIGDSRAAALGIAGTSDGTATGAAGGVSGASFTSGTGNNALSDYTKAGEAALNVTSQSSASAAITVIDQAISAVSTQNSQLGAYQDRLQDTSDNLNTGSQNLTSANAQLVDVDMASEMSAYTQDSILVQAATSMLAQAQQEPQSVLKLLQ
jgi:flagellin